MGLTSSKSNSNKQSGGNTCKRGQIKRKGYTTKSGKKVQASCIRDRGQPGKGPYTLPPIKNKGYLTQFGYKLKDSFEKRKKALDKAIKKYGALAVERHINLVRNYSKSEKANYKKYTKDLEYAKKQRLKGL